MMGDPGVSQRFWTGLKTGSGLSVAIVGLVTIAGWLTELRVLSGIRPQFIPMAPNTAIAFLLMGVSVMALPVTGTSGYRRRVAGLLSAIVALLAGLRLAEYVLPGELGVDAWFFRVPVERLDLAPVGKMALFTALTFELASVALLVSACWEGPFARNCAGVGGSGVAISGSIFVLGYAYAAPLLYGGPLIPMALNTAVSFFLLGIGLIAAAGPRATPLRAIVGPSIRARLLRAFLPFTVALVLLSDWLTLSMTWLAPRSWMAIMSLGSVAIAAVIAASLCAIFAGRIGGQLERAEEDLRRANELLESRVFDRTRELLEATALLEERHSQLQKSTDELARTSTSVRMAHEELKAAHEDLKRAEAQLVQSERLSSLGQVVAGVAHEINNPLAFVVNNVAVLQRDVGQLNELIRLYQEAEGTLEQHHQEQLARIHELAEQMDLAYVLEHVPAMMTRSREGLRRIQQIVKDLRDFARLDEAELKEADVNQSVGPTISILQCQAAARGVTLIEDLAPLAAIVCYPAKINQVVFNLVTNALDACDPGGTVTVSTRPGPSGGIELIVADDGRGIEPTIRSRIFDPFFTTKPIGQGTGLGLAISYGVVASHGGTIEVESAPGLGSRFIVRLPAEPSHPAVRPSVVPRISPAPGEISPFGEKSRDRAV